MDSIEKFELAGVGISLASQEGYATGDGRGIHRRCEAVHGVGITGYAAVLQWLENTGIGMEGKNKPHVKAYSSPDRSSWVIFDVPVEYNVTLYIKSRGW